MPESKFYYFINILINIFIKLIYMSTKKKPYCGAKSTMQKNQRRGTMTECVKANQIRQYGVQKIDQQYIDYVKESKLKLVKLNDEIKKNKLKLAKLRGMRYKKEREFKIFKDPEKKKQVVIEGKKIVSDIKETIDKLKELEKKKERLIRIQNKKKKQSKK